MATHLQLARYGLVGLVSNGILYVAYLVLTYMGMGHKTAVSVLFVVGVTQTFLLNKRWTFAHRGYGRESYARYWVAYGAAYILNLALLMLFVDWLGYNHRIVQGLLVLGIALLLFLAQKFWVFREIVRDADGESGQTVRP